MQAGPTGMNMRLTIVAGLIVGMSLAFQSAVGAHIRAQAGLTVKARKVHEKTVAPWYVAEIGRIGSNSQQQSES